MKKLTPTITAVALFAVCLFFACINDPAPRGINNPVTPTDSTPTTPAHEHDPLIVFTGGYNFQDTVDTIGATSVTFEIIKYSSGNSYKATLLRYERDNGRLVQISTLADDWYTEGRKIYINNMRGEYTGDAVIPYRVIDSTRMGWGGWVKSYGLWLYLSAPENRDDMNEYAPKVYWRCRQNC